MIGKMADDSKWGLALIFISLFPLLLADGVLALIGMSEKTLCYVLIVDCGLIAWLRFRFQKRLSKCMVVLGGIYACILLSAILNKTFNLTFLHVIGGLSACWVFDFWLQKEHDRFIRVVHVILVIMVIINFASIILFPKGMYTSRLYSVNWLLGHKNSHMQYIILALIFNSMWAHQAGKRAIVFNIVFMVLCSISLLMVDAIMSIVIVLMFCGLTSLFRYCERKNILNSIMRVVNIKLILILSILVFAGTLVMCNNELVLGWITELSALLGRSTPFNGRLPIWNASLMLIKNSPIFGYGMIEPDIFVKLSGIGGGTHAHSYILNIMIMGGIICLIGHVYLYYIVIKKIESNKCFLAGLFGSAIGLYFFSGITNVNFYSTWYNVLFIIVYNVALEGNLVNHQKR